MNDAAILKMINATTETLSMMESWNECDYLAAPYNALLVAARENHPNDSFLMAMPMILAGEYKINGPGLNVLYRQLRVAIESILEEKKSTDGSEPIAGSVET